MTYRQEIERQVTRWRPVLGLADWDVRLAYTERKHLATCEAEPHYEQATLRFNLPRIRREVPKADLPSLVLHELVHAITWEKDAGEAANELLTTRVERSILRAYFLGKAEAD